MEESLGHGYVRLRVAEAERRQAKHDIRCVEDVVIELLRNARDAGARHLFVATWREDELRQLVVLDDGVGVPAPLWDRIFDARVTSKLESVHLDRWGVHGRGMALFSIRENARLAQVESSFEGGGCALRVCCDTTQLAERADQSSWPQVGKDEQGDYSITRGPHNIIRTCCEFALEERGRCDVYVGSPAEIVATARAKMRPDALTSADLLAGDLSTLPVLQRFSLAADARELVDVSAGCGLVMSERTAYRIISGAIRPVRSIASRLLKGEPRQARETTVDLSAEQRGLRLSHDDAEAFLALMERDFQLIADRYYLKLSEHPRIRVSGDRMTVSFSYESED